MANVKISELNELTQVDDDDLLVVVDTSANETKKIRAENVGTGGGGDSTPIGTIEAFSGSTAPNGYLMCDGSAISRNAYADLFAVIGTTYGSGDGSTTFNLPNLKGRTIVMRDSTQTEFDTLGETGGSKELQEHNHGYTIANASGLYSETATSSSISGRGLIWGNDSANTGSTGTGNSGNLQPYIVLNYVIKAFKVSSTPATSQVVNAYSESTNDVYSCNYINKAFSGVVLWTNSNPSSEFAAQNITLSSGDYNYLEIYFRAFTNENHIKSVKIEKGQNALLDCYFRYESQNYAGVRYIDYVNDTTLTVQVCYSTVSNNVFVNQADAAWLIPIKIIGYK